jgi:hypothetical protein
MDEFKKLISEDRAMELLGWKRAKLRQQLVLFDIAPVPQGKDRYYPLDSITRLAQVTRKEFMTGVALPARVEMLTLEVRQLHRLLRNLSQMLGIAHAFWRPTDDELLGLYDKASSMVDKYNAKRPPKASMVDYWLVVIARLTAEDFHALHLLHKEDRHPWRPFWIVTSQMQHALKTHHRMPIREEEMMLVHRISLCIDALQRSVMVYIKIIAPDEDFHRIVHDALTFPDMTVQEIELQQFTAEDGRVGDPSTAAKVLMALED